jgi:high affinity sulfate transporter 1
VSSASGSAGFVQKLKSVFNIINWLPQYKAGYFGWDLIAGITLASFVLPESMAYATLAGVPPEYGIYCIIAGGLLFAIFTSAKHVVVGPTSAISLMVGTTVSVLSGGNLHHWAAIASLTALVIFVLCMAAYFLRLSSLVSFISESILLGFKAGAALTIISSQLPKLFSIEGGGKNFFEKILTIIQKLPETNIYVFAFGISAFILLRIGNKLFPGRPVSLVVVVVSIVLISVTDIAQHGFHLAGTIPEGLPPLGRPSLRFSDVDGIFGLALGCFLMGYIETMAVAKTFAQKHNYKVNARQELLSLGFANLGAAFASGYPVAGGLSQSTVNDKAGAKTPLTLVICSLILMVILLFFTHLLQNLPEVMLAAVVLDAVLGLIKIKALKRLYTLSKTEFSISMIAILGVLTFGILKGVLIAAFISIILLIAKSKMPNIAVLGLIPGTNRFSDIKRNPANVEVSYIKILRVEAAILYFNEETVHELLAEHTADESIKMVILDFSAVTNIDIAGSEMILKFTGELKDRGIRVKIVEALGIVRDTLRKLGIDNVTGHISRKDSIQNEVEAFQKTLV